MRKLVLVGLIGLVALGLDRMLASPHSSAPVQSLSYNSPNDWDRIKELFH